MLGDELKASWDYDQRIEEFIKRLEDECNADLFGNIGYIIVDEIQDTVGVRARMLKTILERVECGVLLLGDYCQAIYDWSVRDVGGMTSDDLRTWLDGQKYNCVVFKDNQRQIKKLDSLGEKLRKSILNNDDEDKQEQVLNDCKEQIPKIEGGKGLSVFGKIIVNRAYDKGSHLILCKTNGDVALVSNMLYAAGVRHSVLQSSQYISLAPWIAMILSQCDGDSMSRTNFLRIAQGQGIEDAEQKWEALKQLQPDDNRSSVLYVREVSSALSKELMGGRRENRLLAKACG
jgi:superfamily I DNA/RNA helicase